MEKLKLALVYGSAREGRLCDKVAEWAAAQVQADATFEISVVDPRSIYPGLSGNAGQGSNGQGGNFDDLRKAIAEADAFLVVTPEYNHSYPAALKLLIDGVYEQWQAKPVAFVSYGGVSGGIRAVEHLRQVFAELHAVSIRDTVSLANAWEQFGEGRSPAGSAARSIAIVLQRLKWWAVALQHARKAVPYNEAAA